MKRYLVLVARFNDITTLINEKQKEGIYRFAIYANDSPGSVYLMRLQARSFKSIIKAIL